MITYPSHQVKITMSANTVNTLTTGGYCLYCFKGALMMGAVPLLWFQSNKFQESFLISWSDRYQIYTSSSPIIENGLIIPSSTVDRLISQVHIDSTTGFSSTGERYLFQNYTDIANGSEKPVTFGLSQFVDGHYNPCCAVQISPNGNIRFGPMSTVVMMFAVKAEVGSVKNGTVVSNAFASGISIEFLSNQNQNPCISFDIDNGWSLGGEPLVATVVAAGQNLLPLLTLPVS